MRYWKRFLFYLMMMLMFTLSFSKDENRITIFEKNNEPAKLKIGVTKVITKELPMDYHYEKKLVYCELPESVGENDTIYVSETLDEIPSISTTSGRKTINNIAKYLTKDIKANSKFNYRIITKADEKTGAEKKYIVIHCKEQAQNIYLYVVDKATYRMKELYRGKFFYNYKDEKEHPDIDYGSIKFFSNNNLEADDEITAEETGAGDQIVVKKKNGTTIKPSEKDAVIYGTNGFPKKFYDTKGLKFYESKIRVKIGNGAYAESGKVDYHDGAFSVNAEVYGIDQNIRARREALKIYADKNDKYMKIKLINWDSEFSAINVPVVIEYMGRKAGGKFYVYRKDSFVLNIDSKQNAQTMNENSGIEVKPTEHFHKETLILYDGKKIELKQNSFPIKNGAKYIKLTRGYLTKFNPTHNSDIKAQIIKDGVIIEENIPVRNGNFEAKTIQLTGINYGQNIGWLKIFADDSESKEQNKYLKYKAQITTPYRDTVVNNFEIRYYSGEDKLLRTDSLKLIINPAEEKRFEETTGGIYVINSSGLNCAFLSELKGDLVVGVDNDAERFKAENAKILGNFPQRFKEMSSPDYDHGYEQRVVITNESENNSPNIFKLLSDGRFNENLSERVTLSNSTDHTAYGNLKHPCTIAIGANNKESLEIAIYDYNANAKTVLNKILKIEYQVKVKQNEDVWVTKKTDRLKILIQPHSMSGNVPKIKVHNPIVWYDYSASDNQKINHDKEAELLFDDAITYDRNGKRFNKNSDLNGRNWIEAKEIPEYTWWERHKVEINTGKGEVVKNTDSNGRTKSTTFIDIGNKNVVGIAYDGKDTTDSTAQTDKSLSFGVAGYDFEGGKGRFIVGQYNGSGVLEKVQEYSVDIDRFSGIHYVDSRYDIKPKKDYIKNYVFNDELDIKPVELEYGEVGFRDLDTRITNQGGGKGIEFRMAEQILLVGQGEYGNYTVPATLEFVQTADSNPKDIERETVGEKAYWIFKGKNERTSSVKIMLKIKTQEALIPSQAKFKLVDKYDRTKSPLRVGVVVNSEKDRYFEEVADLYINTGIGRFVRTELVFENINIEEDAKNPVTGEMKWIKLNATDYPNGHIDGYKGANWGVVNEDVIDIPKIQDKDRKLHIEVFDENYTDKLGELNNNNIVPVLGMNNLQLKYDPNTTYINFRLNNKGKYAPGKTIKFYLRYETVNKNNADDKKYLFTQQYTVIFNEKAGFIGSTTVSIKNPMMSISGENGYILVDKKNYSQGKPIGNGNHNTNQDQQQWWQVQNPINYPDVEKYNYTLYADNTFTTELTEADLKDIKVDFVKPDPNQKVSALKTGITGLNFDGKELTKDIYIKWTEKNPADGVVWERKDKLTIVREKFDPTYYGKLFPSAGVDENGANSYQEICEVGSGYEALTKDTTAKDHYIDLDTSYRDYQRYMGVLEQVGLKEEFVVKGKTNIMAIKAGDSVLNAKSIRGEIVFREDIEAVTEPVNTLTVKINSNNTAGNLAVPKKYKLYFKVDSENYKKLDYGTKYNLVVAETLDKNVVEIGYKNKTNDLGCQPIKIKNNLNFTTSKQPFIIETYVLDFGTINILFNDGTPIEKHGKTYAVLSGEDIKNITLTVDKSHVIENGKSTTYINRYDENGLDQTNRLKVYNIELLEQVKDPNKPNVQNDKEGAKAVEKKIYTLDADLLVPLDSKIGNYIGGIYINSTIIN